MKASEQLKRDLIAQMRNCVNDQGIDVSSAQIDLNFTHEVPSDYEGCESVYTAKLVKLEQGQVVVTMESDDDETTCNEADLLSQTVETIEALAEAVQDAAKGQ